MRKILPLVLLLVVSACGGDEDSLPKVDCSGHCYVLATAVSGTDDANTYVRVMDHVESGELDLRGAHEFAGWSDIKVSGGKLFVSDGESPEVMRFIVADDGELVDDGVIGFGNVTSDASMYAQLFVSDDKAVLLADTGNFVIWSPETLTITDMVPMPQLADREGLPARPSGDRGTVVRDGLLFEAVAFGDYENFAVASTSAIVVLDLDTYEVVDILEADCPDLNVGSIDVNGDIYFSNWVYSPATTLLMDGAPTCMVTIPEGSNQIDTAATRIFSELTYGHEAGVLSMLGGGERGILSVFIEDNATYVPEQGIFSWIFGNNWKSYGVDLTTGALTELVGLPWHGGGYYQGRADEVDYVLLPEEGYTRTSVWAIDDAGAVSLAMRMNGWATRLYQLR